MQRAIATGLGDSAPTRSAAALRHAAAALLIGWLAASVDAPGLAARGGTPAAFGGCCIPRSCVAPSSNTPGILGRRALLRGRIARLGATLDFHHGLLAAGGQSAASRPEQKSPAERATERIRALERESEALVAQESQLLVELRRFEVDRQLKVTELAEIARQQTDAQRAMAAASARSDELRRTAATSGPDAEARLVQIYKLGRAGYWRLLFDVDDLRAVGRAYRTAAAMTRLDRERIDTHRRTVEQLATEQGALTARITDLAALEAKAARARETLDRAVESRTALVASIDARRDLNARLAAELQSAQQRLQTSVSGLASSGVAALPLRPFQGALPWPAGGALLSRFGKQPTGRYGTAVVRNGIEVGSPEGQPVRTVHEGVVAYAEPFTGYGNLVIVEHGDRAFSLYGHLGAIDVIKGDHVEAQFPIGRSGRNPSGIPAVYFELRVDGKPVDPVQWLKKGSP